MEAQPVGRVSTVFYPQSGAVCPHVGLEPLDGSMTVSAINVLHAYTHVPDPSVCAVEESPLDSLIIPESRLFVPLSVGPRAVNALLDGGAAINCVHQRVLDPLIAAGAQLTIFPNNIGRVGTADENGSLNVIGRVTLPCLIGSRYMLVTFAVCASLSQDMILGRPFSKQYVRVLNERTNTLFFVGGGHVSLGCGEEGYESQGQLARKCVCAPAYGRACPGTIG